VRSHRLPVPYNCDQGARLVREIEQMEQALWKRMYRGLLKNLARVWNPKDIQDPAIQQKVLVHMQAAERGFRRLDAALERVEPENADTNTPLPELAVIDPGGQPAEVTSGRACA
jgi:hypothetical protein